MHNSRIRAMAVAMAFVLAFVLAWTVSPSLAAGEVSAAASTARPGTALALARPTGPYPTGTVRLHLRDDNRSDPLDPQGGPRELMAQLWYPAERTKGAPLAPYAPPGETAVLQTSFEVPAGAFAATTHSRVGVPVRRGTHKMVFYYHGLCGSRTDDTAVIEQLASLGFVVVALASTHESVGVEFPGGRMETTSDPTFCLAGGDPFSEANQAILRRLLDVRVADVRFTLDRMEQINRGANPSADSAPLPRGLAHSLHTTGVGIFGHSFGGGTAAAVIDADPRFAAGVNLDGFVIGPVATRGLDKPFLVLGSSYHEPAMDPSWATFLPRLTAWHRWLRITDAGHYRFIDLGGSATAWGLKQQMDPENWRLNFGDIPDATSQRIVIRLTTAFFQYTLRDRYQPILDRPERFYPQVRDMTGTI